MVNRYPNFGRWSLGSLSTHLYNGCESKNTRCARIFSYNRHLRPGKYLSLDCEMVGVGIEGVESSLARVSLVNYYGALQLDEFVRQRERVVDYRTQWSGIRETDMIKGALQMYD